MQHVFPLLYLLLVRHFEIMRLARTRILNVDEMYDAGITIAQVIDPISDRCRDLTGKLYDGGVGSRMSENCDSV